MRATKELRRFINSSVFKTLLESSKSSSRVVPLDASWYLPNVDRSASKEFIQERLPGAVFFDIDTVKDDVSPYPHMLPSKDKFEREMSRMGLRNDDSLVVYDIVGNFSSPRVYWMLRLFGHKQVYLLDSFPEYKSKGGQLESGPVKTVSSTSVYKSPGFNSRSVVLYEELLDIVQDTEKLAGYYIVDARPNARFTGEAPEPRPGLSSGHVPGALSIPFSSVVKDGKYLPKEDIAQVFQSRGVGTDKPVILMCGTGVTACVLESGLRESGYTSQDIRVYDGSWTEWAMRAPPELIVKDVNNVL